MILGTEIFVLQVSNGSILYDEDFELRNEVTVLSVALVLVNAAWAPLLIDGPS